jgi:uncharacterized RDD family membrane protein YckC
MIMNNDTMQNEVKYAGFWIRFAAYMIDYLIIYSALALLIFPAAAILGFSIVLPSIDGYNEYSDAYYIVPAIISFYIYSNVISLAGSWLYFALMQSSKHQATVGKMAVGIKVTDSKHQRLTFARATGRYFSKIISSITLLVGYILAGFTFRKQSLHDMIANTYVIYKR